MIEQIDSAIRACQSKCDEANYRKVYDLLGASLASGWDDAQGDMAQRLIADTSRFECVWALTLLMMRWQSGKQSAADFLNLWNTARFAGIPVEYSQLAIDTHLTLGRQLMATWPSSVPYILVGNLLRLSLQFSQAQDVYLAGLLRHPDDPFLKLRLADLYLATYQMESAQRLLRQLQPRYPYAREMMFLDHAPGPALASVFGPQDAGAADMVCFVAADPGYLQRYALEYGRSLRQFAGHKVHAHIHVVREAEHEMPAALVDAMGQVLGSATLTQRTLRFDNANPNWIKAMYASERFLVVAELLEKYNKPVLVSDIDVLFLRDPTALLARLGDHDFMYTNFRNTNEAWERYAATVMLIRPTPASIAFFKRMAAMVLSTLQTHPQPWFVDQIALFRLIEDGAEGCRPLFVDQLLGEGDTVASTAYFKILHASWQ